MEPSNRDYSKLNTIVQVQLHWLALNHNIALLFLVVLKRSKLVKGGIGDTLAENCSVDVASLQRSHGDEQQSHALIETARAVFNLAEI